MGRYQAIFLDAGFTILDMHPSWDQVYVQTAQRHGLELSPQDVPRAEAAARSFFRAHYYQPNDIWTDDGAILDFWIGYYRAGLQALGCALDRVGPCARELALLTNEPRSWIPYPEVPAVLAGLKGAGYTVGILSDWSSDLPGILEVLGLRAHIDFLVVSAIEGLAKPRPAFFRRALERAGVPASRALMVGDSMYADIQGARQVGISGVLLNRDGRPADSAGPTIHRLDELWPFLDGGPEPPPRSGRPSE